MMQTFIKIKERQTHTQRIDRQRCVDSRQTEKHTDRMIVLHA